MSNLPARVRKGLAMSFAARGLSMAMVLGSSVILARLLTPGEMGIYAVGAAVTGFMHALRDFGVGGYLVQERELTPDRVRAAFTLTLAFGWTAAALVLGLSGPAAAFYAEPGIRKVLSILSLNFLFLPFGSPTLALLSRDLKFSLIYRIAIAGGFVTAATSVALATSGAGFVSLAWGAVAGTATTTILAVWARRRDPFLRPTMKEWRRVFSFSVRLTGSQFITQVGVSASDLILGRLRGFAPVALCNRAQGLIQVFNTEIMGAASSVAGPAFAAQRRDGAGTGPAYLRVCGMVSGVAWPFFVFLGLMADPVIRVLFGSQWDAAVPLVRILVVGGIIYQSLPMAGPVLAAAGRADVILRSEAAIQSARVAMVAIGALHSLEAVCVAQVATYALYGVIYSRAMLPLVGVPIGGIARASWRSAVVTLSAAAGPVGTVLRFGLEPAEPFLALLIAAATSGIGWLLAVMLVRHPLSQEIRIVATSARGLLATTSA